MDFARPEWSCYNFVRCNPILNTDPNGDLDDDHYINKDGTIETVKTNDNFDRFFTQNSPFEGGYTLRATLTKNDKGLVEFPTSGEGFERYGINDVGGESKIPKESVGSGDHFISPQAAAALFGIINELQEQNIKIYLGDMSSSNGSDPWQSGSKHHGGHGHNGNRTGLDVDFRYLNNSGTDIQSDKATSDKQFSVAKNKAIYNAAERFGLKTNYQGTNGKLTGVTKVGGHNDHGHIGVTKLNWKYVNQAPTNNPPSLNTNSTLFQWPR